MAQFHVRFCFPDAATADAFHERFGGTRLTYSPFKPGRPAGPRVRYQRSVLAAVEAGLVASLNRPGGNVTAVVTLNVPDRSGGN